MLVVPTVFVDIGKELISSHKKRQILLGLDYNVFPAMDRMAALYIVGKVTVRNIARRGLND